MYITKAALLDALTQWEALADAGGCAAPGEASPEETLENSTAYLWEMLEQHPDTGLDNIDMIASWINEAKPTPTDRDVQVQLGVHFEEVTEHLETLKGLDETSQVALTEAMATLRYVASGLKQDFVKVEIADRKEFLDACCDQIVTATGSAHLAGMSIVEAVGRVNESNWSKFVDGKPIFDENGKIAKGPNYSKCDLEGLY